MRYLAASIESFLAGENALTHGYSGSSYRGSMTIFF